MQPDFRGLWFNNRNELVRVTHWDMEKGCWIGITGPLLSEREYDGDGNAKDGTKLMVRKRG